MFDIGMLELFVVAVVALIVIGPERLPKVARTAGMWLGRGRRFISSVKEDIDREIKADELRQILEKQKQNNPLHEIVEDTKKSFGDIKSETESAVNAAAKSKPPHDEKMNDNVPLSEQPFISHLIELRDRLLRMVIAVIALLVVLFPFGNDIFHMLAQPVMNALPEGNSMIATKVLSPFLTPLKLAFVASVFLAMPYLLYQLWSFIAPGLYQHEKRLAMPLLVSSIILFYLGAAFAYFVVLPLLFPFLVGVTPKDVEVMPDIADYLDIAIRLFFAFGLAFEVPIATILLVLAKATTPEKLTEKRPYVIVGAFVIGMLLTPPDIISQTMLAVPMWVLFELGLVVSRMLVRAREQDAREADADEDAPAASAAAASAATAAGAGAAAAAAETADDGDFRPLNEKEMDDEFDRIEAEFDALPDTLDDSSRNHEDSADKEQDADGAAGDAGSGEDKPAWSSDDSADMLDEEETFPQRSAIEALVDSKLEQVAALRNTGAYDEARRLLYEVLSEGNETQVKVARNILEQLDN